MYIHSVLYVFTVYISTYLYIVCEGYDQHNGVLFEIHSRASSLKREIDKLLPLHSRLVISEQVNRVPLYLNTFSYIIREGEGVQQSGFTYKTFPSRFDS